MKPRDETSPLSAGIEEFDARPVAVEAVPASARETGDSFRSLVEQAPEAIFIETHHCFSYVNAAAVRLFGASRPEDLLGQPVLERIHPDCRGQLAERIRLLKVERRQMPATDVVALARDGTAVQVSISAVPYEFQHTASVLVFARDVSERKRTETALRHSEHLFRSVWETSQDPMRIIDGEGTVVMVNRAFCDLMGRSRQEIEGHSMVSVYAVENRQHILTAYRRRYQERNFAAYSEKKVKLADGREIWLAAATALLDLGEPGPFVLDVFRNVTERKRTEHALAEQLNELQRWHDATLDRERRVLQLKREVNELLARGGEPARYGSVAGENAENSGSMPGATLTPPASR